MSRASPTKQADFPTLCFTIHGPWNQLIHLILKKDPNELSTYFNELCTGGRELLQSPRKSDASIKANSWHQFNEKHVPCAYFPLYARLCDGTLLEYINDQRGELNFCVNQLTDTACSKKVSVVRSITNLGDIRAEFEAAGTIAIITTNKVFEQWNILKALVGHVVKH